MANAVDAYQLKQLDGMTGVTPYTSPTTVYLALFTADPTGTGSVANELSGDGYARKSLSGLFSAASGTGGENLNTSVITFATATAEWVGITHAAAMESGTAATADMMFVIPLNATVSIPSGEPFEFKVGTLDLNFL